MLRAGVVHVEVKDHGLKKTGFVFTGFVDAKEEDCFACG